MDHRPGPPKRFSHQVQQLKFKRGLEVALEESHTEFPEKTPVRSRSYNSVPNLKGKFNYDLERTKFLGETKMRAKRIASNPKRFLDAYAESRRDLGTEQEFVPTELPELDHFIQQLALDDRFEKKEAIMNKRTESAKFRTFLLAMTSTSAMEVDPKTLAFLESWSAGGGDGGAVEEKKRMYEDAEGMETLVTNYMVHIRGIDTSAIQTWIAEFLDLADLELPYGLPTNIPSEIPRQFGESKEITAFIESAQDNFILLDASFHIKIQEITKELKTIAAAMEQDWSLEESSLLFYVINSFTAIGSETAAILPLQIELMRRLFPEKSQNDITKQKYRLRMKKSLEEKRSAVIRAWVHDKGELQFKLDVAWKEVTKKRLAELECKLSIKKQKDICDFWAERLQKLRQEKCESVQKLKVLVEPIEKYRETKTKSIAESEAQRREAAKIELKKYHLQKQYEEEEMEKRLEAERVLAEAELVQRVARNKPRVSHRANQRHLKAKARRELEAALDEQRRLRQQQLEQTKEPVEIDYDPANVVTDTHASMVRRVSTLRDQKRTEDERMARVFRECYSFTSDSVMKDRRLRFEVKLKEAGILDSAYARQVLLAMEPKPKPHLQSNVKLSHDEL